MKVTLGVAIRLPGRPLYKRGSVVEVNEQEKELLQKLGALASSELNNNVTVTKQDQPMVTEEVPADKVQRPAKTASAEKWAEYLNSQGIDPKGLSKREMIAAAG